MKKLEKYLTVLKSGMHRHGLTLFYYLAIFIFADGNRTKAGAGERAGG